MGLDLNETSFRKKNQWLNHPLLLKETSVQKCRRGKEMNKATVS